MLINNSKKSIIICIICIILINNPVYSIANVSQPKASTGYEWTDKVLFFGDSLTVGLKANFGLKWGRGTGSDNQNDCYDRIDVNNRVYVGTTTEYKGTGSPKNYTLPQESEIEAIAIMIGTNGASTSYVGKVKDIVQHKLRKLYPNTTIYIEGIPPFTVNSQSAYLSSSEFLRLSKEYNKELKNMCNSLENVVYVEVASELKDSNGYLKTQYAYNDGIHLNKQGGQVLLDNLKSYIKKTVDMSSVKFEDKRVTYNGQAQSIKIEGTLPEGVTVTYEGNGKTNVGKYGVIAKFKVDTNTYKEIPNMTANLIIEKATPKVNPIYNKNVILYERGILPEIKLSQGDTQGTIEWDDYKLEAGTKEYTWTFTPTDKTNYNTKTGKIKFTVQEIVLSKIEIKELPSKTKYERGSNLDTTGLILTAVYNDNSTKAITEGFKCSPTKLYTAGKQEIKVVYQDKTTSFSVIVEKSEPIVNPLYNDKEIIYIDEQLPEIKLSKGDTQGTIEWDDYKLSLGTKEYTWTFTPTDITNYNKKTGKIKITVLDKLKVVINDRYIEKDSYITKINYGETIKDIKNNIKTNGNIEIYKGLRKIGENEKVGTGMRIKITLHDEQKEYIMVIAGDTNGDGAVNFKDIVQINKHRLNKVSLTEEYLKAGDITEDGKVNFKDILKVNKVRLNKI